ncbi:MAG: hypothetical protein WD042_02785 [Phycisphaeraceae bacterium]
MLSCTTATKAVLVACLTLVWGCAAQPRDPSGDDGAVTPADNAAVKLVQITGLPGDVEARDRVLAKLQTTLPERARYFVALRPFARAYAKADDPATDDPALDRAVQNAESDLYAAASAPWPAQRHPLIAAWIQTNAPHLDALVAAAAGGRYWMPMRDTTPAMARVIQIQQTLTQQAAAALAARAMRRLHDGDALAAWQETLALQRLATLMLRCTADTAAPRGTHLYPAMSISLLADTAVIAIAQYSQATPAQLTAMLRQLRALPVLPTDRDSLYGQARARHLLAALSLALAAYYGDHQTFPPRLDALVPVYSDAVPADPLASPRKTPVYRVSQDQAVVYSLGANGQDDGGHPEFDIVLEMIPPTRPR